ncbi:MAG: transposase [Planctomycetaceae bacterium]|nr:transposase [Planctomycetaceae bacterium]
MAGHTFSHHVLHVIFSTKQRRPLIRPDWRTRLYEYLCGIARQEFGCAMAVGGTDNHIHGLLSIRTDIAIADALRKWKSLSSRWIHETYPAERLFAWQAGYGSFGVSSSNEEKVKAYILDQERHHHTRTFEEEFVELLRRHKVDYDPRYVFD